MQTMTHPVLGAAAINAMSPHEQLYFTDTPACHVAAFRDFQRAVMIERRNADAFNAYQANARLRAHEARG